MVSIDNLGIAVWGWVLGGILIGLSSQREIKLLALKSYISSNRKIPRQKITAYIATPLLLGVLTLIGIFYRGETLVYQQKQILARGTSENSEVLREIALKTISTPLLDPRYKFLTSVNLINNGFGREGLPNLIELVVKDPRDLMGLNALAQLYEQVGEEKIAVDYRIKISEVDPHNAENYRDLIRMLRAMGQNDLAEKYQDLRLNLIQLREVEEE